jgi:hypothetical protein
MTNMSTGALHEPPSPPLVPPPSAPPDVPPKLLLPLVPPLAPLVPPLVPPLEPNALSGPEDPHATTIAAPTANTIPR